jgi:cytochrome oxidase Cu insertion factor (SCO1/SenC/PrrC family)
MNTGLNPDDPVVVAAFRAALLHQGLIALLIFAVLGAAWAGTRAWRRARSPGDPAAVPGRAGPEPAGPEPAGRLLLVVGFGNLWLFDGILQAQPKMALGLPSQVIEPTAASSPLWVQHVVNWAGTTWSYHPMEAAAAAVWIQVGLGIWMLAAPRGALSRLGGLAGVGWGLVVWVFGESFGGIFAPGLSWLTGAPGAAAVYVVAGVLIALPERTWHSPRLGRLVLAGLGLFLVGMAVVQAWPGNGFWTGLSHDQPGPLAGMSLSMSVTPQPGILAGWLSAFAALDEAHGVAVNLVAVAALAVTGAAFLSGRRALIRPAFIVFTALCLASWVLIEDLGFLGGLGTDPNNMIPFILLAGAGYLALVRAAPSPDEQPVRGRARARPAVLVQQALAASSRSVVAVGGAAVIVLGAAPLAVAQASRQADPILAQSIVGSSAAAGYPAPGFTLTGQRGQLVTQASLRGKVVLLTFLDPACRADCPPAGPEFRQVTQMLGGRAGDVDLVGVSSSLADRAAGAWPAFDRRQGLNRVPGWLYLTGTPAQLRRVWQEYGITAARRGYAAFVIDPTGRVRQEFRHDPGPGTAATRSSFAVLFADAARQALSER